MFSLPPQSSHAFLFSFFSLVHDWKRRQRYKGTEVKDVNFRLWKKLSISIPPPFYFSSPYPLPPTTHTPPLNPNKSPRLSLFSKWSHIVLPPSRQQKNKGETSFTTQTLGLRQGKWDGISSAGLRIKCWDELRVFGESSAQVRSQFALVILTQIQNKNLRYKLNINHKSCFEFPQKLQQ